MSAFRDFAVSFCTVGIGLGAFILLCPAGKFEKTVRYVLGVVFLICVLSFVPILKSVSMPKISASSNLFAFSESLSVTAFRLTLETALKENQINFKDLTVCTDISENGSIVIYKVVIKTEEPQEKILDILGNSVGNCEVEVQHE